MGRGRLPVVGLARLASLDASLTKVRLARRGRAHTSGCTVDWELNALCWPRQLC
jgi:hypothetical protein